MKRMHAFVAGAAVVVALTATTALVKRVDATEWSDEERRLIGSLSLHVLPPLSPDPGNRVGDDPDAAWLGHRLFFDTRLSADGTVSCASCHQPQRDFQDGLALGVGTGVTARRTMPIAGTAYGAWQFWDGRKDSQWSQALGPLESAVEHGGSRLQYAHLIASGYRTEYERVFGPVPDLTHLPAIGGPVDDPAVRAPWEALSEADRHVVNTVFANIGKAIAAYERTLRYAPARFDAFAEAVVRGKASDEALLTAEEREGLRLFIGKAQCINCHNGPLFTDFDFHNTGVPARADLPREDGRAAAVSLVLEDPFNCLGPYSDALPEECGELHHMLTDEDALSRAFKTPSLRNVAGREPFMHAGQFRSVRDVLEHYDQAPDAPFGHSEIQPLHLSKVELRQLEAFLHTLSGPVIAPENLLHAPDYAPSGAPVAHETPAAGVL